MKKINNHGCEDCPHEIKTDGDCNHEPGIAGGKIYCKKCGIEYKTDGEKPRNLEYFEKKEAEWKEEAERRRTTDGDWELRFDEKFGDITVNEAGKYWLRMFDDIKSFIASEIQKAYLKGKIDGVRKCTELLNILQTNKEK